MTNIEKFPDMELIEEEASLWIVRFEGDEEPSDQQIARFHQWMAQSPAHRETLIKLASSWNEMDMLSQLAVPIDNAEQSQVSWFRALLVVLFSPFMALRLKRQRWAAWAWQGVAVSAVIAVCIGLLFSSQFFRQNVNDNIYITQLGQQSTHQLADGSTLWLNTDSEVEVLFDPQLRRLNLHRGEAHFDVEHDPQRPFEVYVGDRLVRAVGTAFSVYRDLDRVKVTVTEGKVDLAIITLDPVNQQVLQEPQNDSTAVSQEVLIQQQTIQQLPIQKQEVLGSLVAGQTAVMPTNEPELAQLEEVTTVEQQDLNRRLSWREGKLVFAGESLDEVVKEVSRYTSVYIEVVDPSLQNLRIGGQFKVGKTDELFDVLESSFGVKVNYLDDTHVQIHAQ